MFVKRADPLLFWQFRQLQIMLRAGGPVRVKVTAPQRQEPLRVFGVDVAVILLLLQWIEDRLTLTYGLEYQYSPV